MRAQRPCGAPTPRIARRGVYHRMAPGLRSRSLLGPEVSPG
jgi:hypothetical protein